MLMRKIILFSSIVFLFLNSTAFACTRQRNVYYDKYYVANLTYTLTKSQRITPLKPYKHFNYHISKLTRKIFSQLALNNAYKNLKHSSKHAKEILYTVSGFEFNHYNLTPAIKNKLRKIEPLLKNKKNITIIGYTDHFGTKKYNDWLALKRAESAKKFLNVEAKVKGYGKCCYISNINKINRRIEIEVRR